MKHRPSAEIREEYEAAQLAAKLADDRESRLKKELDAALVAEASHPWIGKRVRRQMKRGWRGEVITRRGVLTVYDPAKKWSYRELYRPDAGDLIVVVGGGDTAFHFNVTPQPGESAWELDQ